MTSLEYLEKGKAFGRDFLDNRFVEFKLVIHVRT